MKIPHHFDWLQCQTLNDADQYIGRIFPCYDPKHNLSFIRPKCGSFQMVVAMNNEPEQFPDNIGLPLDFDENQYFIIEGHFANPTNNCPG